MKLQYFELLSPDPFYVPGVGGILSPRLKDISSIGISTYQYYLGILSMDLESYFSMTGHAEQYKLFSDEELSQIGLFDLLITNEQSDGLLQNILNFFIREDVSYSPGDRFFIVRDNEKVAGAVTKENYSLICDLICQRNGVRPVQTENPAEVKNKKASEILKKLQKGRAEKSRQNRPDQNMELGNIISAVAGKSSSLNLANIWNLTVFQLWDSFSRLSHNSIYDIQSTSAAVWGSKNNSFDASSWYQRI